MSTGYKGKNFDPNFSKKKKSQPDRPQRKKSYEQIISEAKVEKESKEEQIQQQKSQPVPKVDNSKKNELVNKGSRWFNKFFAGIDKKSHANFKITYNDDLDLQVMESYAYKLSNMAFTKIYYDDFSIKFSGDFFRVYFNTLVGIKMLKANANFNQVTMKEFNPLLDLEIKVPKNLGVIINCIGKTDIGQDHVVRIVGQNSVIKYLFFKAVMLTAAYDKSRFFNNMNFKEDIDHQKITEYVDKHLMKDSIVNIYTKDQSGLDLIHDHGRKAIELINKTDLKIGDDSGTDILARVPYLDPKDSGDIDKLLAWEKKTRLFLSKTDVDVNSYINLLGYVFMGWFPLRFLQQGDKKTFVELDGIFKDTIFEKAKPISILEDRGWYSIDKFMDDRMLFDNLITVVDYYKTNIEPIYNDLFHMVSFVPTAYGSGAQTVKVNQRKRGFLNFNKNNREILVADNARSTELYARISEEESVLGSIFEFNRALELDTGYNVHTIGTSKEIRLAFVGYDFK